MLNMPFGYFWAFPRKTSLSLGLGGMATEFRNMRNLLKGIAHLFTKRLGLPPFVLHGIRGYMLPLFKYQRPITSNRVLLTGDAARFVDTFTGQGICYALESGLLAAKAVINISKRNRDPNKVISQYLQLVQQRFGEELRCSYSIARFIHSHVHGFIQISRRLKSFSKVIFDLASGKTDYYRIIRNPLRFCASLFVNELQNQIHRRASVKAVQVTD
jgi:flavin-dependent dehydrogenase